MQSIVERYNRQKTEVIVKDYPNINSYNCKHNRNRQIFDMLTFLALRTYQYFLLLKRDDSLASAKSLVIASYNNFVAYIRSLKAPIHFSFSNELIHTSVYHQNIVSGEFSRSVQSDESITPTTLVLLFQNSITVKLFSQFSKTNIVFFLCYFFRAIIKIKNQ